MHILLLHRPARDVAVSTVESTLFELLSSTVKFLGITFFPFCDTFVSLNQQAAPAETVRYFFAQAADLRVIQALGLSISFPRLCDAARHQLSLTLFTMFDDQRRTSSCATLRASHWKHTHRLRLPRAALLES